MFGESGPFVYLTSYPRHVIGTGWRRRIPLVLVVAACVAGAVAAVAGGTRSATGLEFAQEGHWVAQPGTDLVFRIDGVAKTVDVQGGVPGIEPGSQVVQGKTSGYVVGDSRIIEFGKSTLKVESTMTPPTGERPVAVETTGGPYLVYREAGMVVRLGGGAKTIPAGGALSDPVATPDGTLWLHRVDTGVLCLLPKEADRISCPAAAPTGHTGALTTVGDSAAFVDTTGDALRRVSADGLGEPVGIGLDLPANARVAPADANGRVPILDPGSRRLHLVDAARLDGRGALAPVTVALADGEYTSPTTSGESVVLLDQTRNTVLTYTSDGRRSAETAIPKEMTAPRLSRGEDARVYVDGTEGEHVLVVDHDGRVNNVPVVGEDSGESVAPQGPPEEPQREPPQQEPREQPRQQPPPDRDTTVLAEQGPRQSPPSRQQRRVPPPPPQAPPPPKPIPASPPGMPPGLAARPQNDDVLVTWGGASANGAPVTAYHVSWSTTGAGGGGTSTPGGARSSVLNGLSQGLTYTVSVVAENSAGRGTPATTRVTVPSDSAPVVTVTRGRTESHDAGCRPPDCGLMLFTLRGFEPNTDYTITPYSNAPGYPGDNPEDGATTDGKGYYQDQAFPFSRVGYDVWVVVEGPDGQRYQSKHYTWESG